MITNAFGNALGDSLVGSMSSATERENLYSLASGAYGEQGLKLSAAGQGLRFSESAQNAWSDEITQKIQANAAALAYRNGGDIGSDNFVNPYQGPNRTETFLAARSDNIAKGLAQSDSNIASMRAQNLARMQGLAAQTTTSSGTYATGLYSNDPGSADYYRQRNGQVAIELSGMAASDSAKQDLEARIAQYGELNASPEIGFFRQMAAAMVGQPYAFARQAWGQEPINLITDRIENFNGADRKLGMLISVLPLPLPIGKAGQVARVGETAFARAAEAGAATLSQGAIRSRVEANIAQSATARGASEFNIHVARADQISSKYIADEWSRTILKKGDVVYALRPGESAYFTNLSTVQATRLDSYSLSQALQVRPHDIYGYRPDITGYKVLQDIVVPGGKASANPAFGTGGGTQFFIQNTGKHLEPITTINLTRP